MQVTYQNLTATTLTSLYLWFLPNGTLDTTRTDPGNLTNANLVLAPVNQTVSGAAASLKIPNFDFWQLISWMFVSQYWTGLLDFGQISGPALFDAQGNAVPGTPTYNIFVNETLFQGYQSYLRTTVLPLFGYTVPAFNPLSDTNQLNDSVVSLEVLYFCTDVQLKDAAGVVISLIVADWAMITALYGLYHLWRLSRKRRSSWRCADYCRKD